MKTVVTPTDCLAVEEMLKNLRDSSAPTKADAALGTLCWQDFPALLKAQTTLNHQLKDKNLDTVLRTRLVGMLGTLNLYLENDWKFTWQKASVLAARSNNCGTSFAQSLRQWIHSYLWSGKLPLHNYGHFRSSVHEDEDFREAIQCQPMEKTKDGYISTQDVMEIVASPEMVEMLGDKHTKLLESTAQRWLKKMEWRYGCKKNGMYIDGHERSDIVEYHDGFVE